MQAPITPTTLPDHTSPAIYTYVKTPFRWLSAGLLWPDNICNFIAHFRSTDVHIPEHISLLSIKYALDGHEVYEMGRERVAVDETAYLVLNDGQDYASSIQGKMPVESFAVFFSPDFASDVLRSLVTSFDQMLDMPKLSSQPVTFFQHRYEESAYILPIIQKLRRAALLGNMPAEWLEQQFHDLLEHLIFVHRSSRHEIESLDSARPSTRLELYRRAHMGRDFMDSHLSETVTVDRIADYACLSSHHFIRTFKQVMHETPHQYLIRKRLDQARRLLSRTDLSVTEICMDVGFESLGSFSWLFSKRIGMSPESFRLNHS